MKALHVIDSLGRGGAEQVLVTLLPELARQGCPAEVAVLRPPYDLQPDLEAQGIQVHRLAQKHRWSLLSRARQLARLARQSGATVVHAHLYFPAICVALSGWLRLHDARTFVSFHNLAYAGANRNSAGLWAKRRLAVFLYPRGLDGTIAVSAAVADHYRSALRIGPIAVLPNPVDPVPQPQVAEIANGDLRIVVPGRLVPEKGHSDLIQALTYLSMPLSITFAGGGALQGALQSSAPNIRITGPLPHEAMLREIATSDLVVIPSRFEGFGLAALEAMSLSRPVIATTAGGLPEVVGTAGILVPPADPKALAAAIQSLADDPDRRRRLGASARARAVSQFSVQAIAAQLLVHYHQYLKERAE